MMCQRCGKLCANRTEGRRVRLAGQDLFCCNVCSLHPVAGAEVAPESRSVAFPGRPPRRGGWLLPRSAAKA